MDAAPHFPAEQCLTLNEVARIIASRRNLPELFHDLAEHLRDLIDFSYLSVMLYDAAQHVMRLHTLESCIFHGCLPPGSWPLYVMSWGGGIFRYNLGVLKYIDGIESLCLRENTHDHIRRSLCAFAATR